MPFNGGFGPLLSAVYRLSRPVPSLTREVTAILQQVDPEGATPRFDSLDDLVAKDASTMRTSLELLASLALVALLLGLSGIYSVVAYGTERRFHEIGIRMAVGARPGDILGLILKSAAAQAVLGITFGVLLSAFTTGFLSSQLYKTSPLDPLTFIAVVAIMAACAVGAAVVPAGRAAAARPSSTLRYE
jgi:putative ABC transport system permease protein